MASSTPSVREAEEVALRGGWEGGDCCERAGDVIDALKARVAELEGALREATAFRSSAALHRARAVLEYDVPGSGQDGC